MCLHAYFFEIQLQLILLLLNPMTVLHAFQSMWERITLFFGGVGQIFAILIHNKYYVKNKSPNIGVSH